MRGKAACATPTDRITVDHPRLCGEKESRLTELKKYPGSPPPMRGKVNQIFRNRVRGGITPAYAGKRQIWTWESWGSGDHPRLCGEKRLTTILKMCAVGSPPPMRGKVKQNNARAWLNGITPAYAGKRCPLAVDQSSNAGSPPPMRGKVVQHFFGLFETGITPAYAGKSCRNHGGT